MLYIDIPSLADLKSLAEHRDDICVSIYLPTTPVSQEAAGERIELKNLARQALHAAELGFPHPVTGIQMHFESALPRELQRLRNALTAKDQKEEA